MTPPVETVSLGSSKVEAILEEIKALPPADQNAFAKRFHSWEAAGAEKFLEKNREEMPPVQWPDFAGRMKKLFPNGPIPGDPQKFWDEMRRG